MAKFLTVFFFISSAMSQHTLDTKLISPFQKAWGIALSSADYHTAKIDTAFGISIGMTQHMLQFPEADKRLSFNQEPLNTLQFRSLYTTIDFPFYAQIGFKVGFPEESFHGLKTSYYGYSGKFQLSQMLWDFMPNLAVQFSHSFFKANQHFEVQTLSPNVQMSFDLWWFTFSGAVLYNETALIEKENSKEFVKTAIYYRAGMRLKLSFVLLYAETTFVNPYQNVTAGFALAF